MAKLTRRRDSVVGLEHDGAKSLKARIGFLKHDPIFEAEDAYALRYQVDGEQPQTNMAYEDQEVLICDLRGQEESLSLDSCGFEVRKLQSSMTYEQFSDPVAIEQIYQKDIERQLKQDLGATAVDILRTRVRRRHPEFPTSIGTSYTDHQPSTAAHIDINEKSAREKVLQYRGDDADSFLQRPYQIINVWKPLRGPLEDWPLAVCDAGSIDRSHDLTMAYICHPGYINHNCQAHFSPKQHWYYLRRQQADEIIVFRQFDSRLSGNNGVPHCSFQDPTTPMHASQRESVEIMAIVYLE